MSEASRQQLKEIRTLQGFEAAYKAAGLPKDNAKRNTKVKRLSRLINRNTGGFKKMDAKTSRKVSRTYQTKTRQKALINERGKSAVRSVQKVKALNRKEARRRFGKDGLYPDAKKLARRLRQNRGLTKKQKDSLQSSFDEAASTGDFRKARAGYTTNLSQIDIDNFASDRHAAQYKRIIDKSRRATWRDLESDLTFEEWQRRAFGIDNTPEKESLKTLGV